MSYLPIDDRPREAWTVLWPTIRKTIPHEVTMLFDTAGAFRIFPAEFSINNFEDVDGNTRIRPDFDGSEIGIDLEIMNAMSSLQGNPIYVVTNAS